MNKLKGLIEGMAYKELKAIQRDLAEGNMGRLVKERLDEIEAKLGRQEHICPTCGAKLAEETAKYHLVFGPPDFRQRAMFCGLDCLSFFLEKLKQERAPLYHESER
ncbi:MAG: hypothetical protein HGA85_04580 [Nanoarchaeota archaeon]|nr:hypothetical protein [Nanoarchaeota archaeon]